MYLPYGALPILELLFQHLLMLWDEMYSFHQEEKNFWKTGIRRSQGLWAGPRQGWTARGTCPDKGRGGCLSWAAAPQPHLSGSRRAQQPGVPGHTVYLRVANGGTWHQAATVTKSRSSSGADLVAPVCSHSHVSSRNTKTSLQGSWGFWLSSICFRL